MASFWQTITGTASVTVFPKKTLAKYDSVEIASRLAPQLLHQVLHRVVNDATLFVRSLDMSTVNPNNLPLTKAEFEAGMQALREYIDQRIHQVVQAQRVADAFRKSEEIRAGRKLNPSEYTEEDVPRLLKEVQAEMQAERDQS